MAGGLAFSGRRSYMRAHEIEAMDRIRSPGQKKSL